MAMADWSSFLPSVITTLSGLGGVWLGARLTTRREELREAAKLERDARYLAILVVAHLDRLIDGCVAVVGDDGTSYGQPAGKDGTLMATVKTPSFDPLSLDVEWKALPADLMYGILSLPYNIEVLNHKISMTGEFDSPPDYSDFFWERQHGYADLGLKVLELAYALRQYIGLPVIVQPDGEWCRDGYLKDQKQGLEHLRAQTMKSCPVGTSLERMSE
ncbi:conserved hypothetical protein [Cupriavidus taiwanensis]|nr:conserved hypothetical protein [Cupriavidus taiwanensis]